MPKVSKKLTKVSKAQPRPAACINFGLAAKWRSNFDMNVIN